LSGVQTKVHEIQPKALHVQYIVQVTH